MNKRPTGHSTQSCSVASPSTSIAVVYCCSTGAIADIARETAEVRPRRVAELTPQEAIDSSPSWAANLAATADIPTGAADDLVWADGVLLGSPTRFLGEGVLGLVNPAANSIFCPR